MSQVAVAVPVSGGQIGWHTFIPQPVNPGGANTLWQDDGSNFDAGTLVWGDLSNPMLIGPNFSVGNPGTEQGGIDVNGANYDAVQKINSVGGSLDASLILHRHSTSFPAILTFARANDETIGHTAVTLGQTLGSQIFVGYSGTHYDIGAVIDARVAPVGTVGAGSLPTELAFFTTPDGSDAALLAMIVGSDQQIYGSNVSQGTLDLAGTQNADLGFINLNSPVIFGPYTNNPLASYGFDYSVVDNPTGAFIGGGLNFSGDITTGHSTFIYESFRGAPTIRTGVAPGFSAYTVLQALPTFEAGAAAGLNPMAPLIVNAGPRINNGFTGTKTTSTAAGMNFAPTVGATVSGATMNVSQITGLIVAPKWGTATGSTIGFGTVRGVHCQNPATGLFQPNNGTETITAYIGLDVNNITFGGTSVIKAAVRSFMSATSVNTWFLLNAGNAHSDHGGGHIYFDDNAGIAYGGISNTSFDVWQTWNSAGYFRTFFFLNGDSLRWTNPDPDRFLFDNDGGSTTGQYNFNCHKFSFGAMTGIVGNGVGIFVTGVRATEVNGGWADFNLTQGANLTINHTMNEVNAWNINPTSIVIGTGSITGYVAGLSVGMTTANVTGVETSAIRVRGRNHHLGVHEYPPLEPAQITASINNYSPATFNSMRQIWRLTSDAAWNITGIAVPLSNNPADTQWIVNAGAFNLTLTHQDAASTAGNRFISPTGANYIIGPDESALLWHDPTTDRWRILWGTGA